MAMLNPLEMKTLKVCYEFSNLVSNSLRVCNTFCRCPVCILCSAVKFINNTTVLQKE